jgi:hypothetical protein
MVSEDKRNEVRHDDHDDDEESQSTPNDLIQARHELQQKIRSSSLNEEEEHGPRDINDDADDHQTSSSPPPSPPPLPHPPSQTHNIMSIANKMCIRKKTIDDFIVMKPRVENNDQDIHSRLPKVRDYQTEISKRVVAAAERLR